MQFYQDDYMRNIENYPRNIFFGNECGYCQGLCDRKMRNYYYDYNNSLELLYPEIYIIINPMIKNIIRKYNITNRTCTKEILEKMVDEIYANIEETRKINNTEADNLKAKENENRTIKNNSKILKDLIKILIINNLINKRKNLNYYIPYERYGYYEY